MLASVLSLYSNRIYSLKLLQIPLGIFLQIVKNLAQSSYDRVRVSRNDQPRSGPDKIAGMLPASLQEAELGKVRGSWPCC